MIRKFIRWIFHVDDFEHIRSIMGAILVELRAIHDELILIRKRVGLPPLALAGENRPLQKYERLQPLQPLSPGGERCR